MSTPYEYSLKNDFQNGMNVKELREEIENNNIISSTCLGIINDGFSSPDKVKIIFEHGLTGGEWRTLDQIIHIHNPVNIPELTKLIVKNVDKESYEQNYERLSKFIFPGAEFCTIKIGGHMDPGGGSWSLMLYDYDHHKKISEETFTNTESMIHDMGFAYDIPENDTTIEIFAKVENGSLNKNIKAYIDSIKLQYA